MIYPPPLMPNATPSPGSGQVLSGVIRREAIEDISGAVRNFFDLDVLQLEPGECRCQIDFIAAGNTFFYREHYPLRTHLAGEVLHDRFGFAIPEEGPNLKFSGEEMDRCRLASALTGEQMDVYAPGGLKQFVILLDHARLLALADQMGVPAAVQQALRHGRSSMPLVAKPSAVNDFSRRLQTLLRQAAAGELRTDAAALEDSIYAETLAVCEVMDAPLGRPPAAVLVRRAIDIAEAQGGQVRIAEICCQLRVSPGTLQRAFKSVTGVSPQSFFLRRQLNAARGVLLRGDPAERKVTEIALELGFHELGRFAVRYRQLFGESPSQTLRRKGRTMVAVQG